ncbi:hypothetical protein M3667_06410 [Microbacterium sp. P26]|uniref:hypothetical protein n=1 Tax=Microbacterium TaxID=33882 RepID=UPI00203E53DD|nr:hypothetical protein [Microbacterium sp. P26]MCM3501513.1 hypothetical protein [Microbacterium sp. P26]
MASTRFPATVALIAAGALALSGCASTPAGGTDAAASDREAVRAITTAEASAGGRAFELETDDGEWQVHVATGDRAVEVRVSSDGSTVRSSQDAEALEGEDRTALEATTTTLADAVRIAAGAGGDAAVDEVQLEDEGGTSVWVVEREGGETVRVSSADGTIR